MRYYFREGIDQGAQKRIKRYASINSIKAVFYSIHGRRSLYQATAYPGCEQSFQGLMASLIQQGVVIEVDLDDSPLNLSDDWGNFGNIP